jgi:probable rRNA maturation factor
MIRKMLASSILPARGAATIKFVSPRTMTLFNSRYRGKYAPTDVLSFPYEPVRVQMESVPADGYLGDILICSRVVEQDSRQSRLLPDRHLLRVAAHGILHLLGYDHDTDRKSARMKRKELRLVREVLRP